MPEVKRNHSNLATVAEDRLDVAKKGGFYRDDYVKDSVEHWTNPAYAQIKPGYRASKPRPNFDQVQVKNLYSFDKWGNQREASPKRSIFDTTYRGTKQQDSVYYRENLVPYNVKHALVDPSHSYHPANKQRNYSQYDFKGRAQKSSEELNAERRTTVDYDGKHVVRLPESKDFYPGENYDPLSSFRATKGENKRFFN